MSTYTIISDLINLFESGDKPSGEDFKKLITSMWHKSEKMPIEQIETLLDTLSKKFEKGTYQGDAQQLYDEIEQKIQTIQQGTALFSASSSQDVIDEWNRRDGLGNTPVDGEIGIIHKGFTPHRYYEWAGSDAVKAVYTGREVVSAPKPDFDPTNKTAAPTHQGVENRIIERTLKLTNNNTNQLDKTDANYQENSYLNENGVVSASSSNAVSQKLPLTGDEVYFVPNLKSVWYACVFDVNDNKIASYKVNEKSYVAATDYENADYCRFTLSETNQVVYKISLNDTDNNQKYNNVLPVNLLDPTNPAYLNNSYLDGSGKQYTTNNSYNTSQYIPVKDLIGKKLIAIYLNDSGGDRNAFRIVTYFDKSFNKLTQVSPSPYLEYTVEDIANAETMRIAHHNLSQTDGATAILIVAEDEYKNTLLYKALNQTNSTGLSDLSLPITKGFPVQNTTLNDKKYRNNTALVTSTFYSSIEFVPKQGKRYFILAHTGGGLPSDMNYLTVLNSSNEVLLANKGDLIYKGIVFDDTATKVVVSYRDTFQAIIIEEGFNSLSNYFYKGDLLADTGVEFGEDNYIKKNITLSSHITFTDPFVGFTLAKSDVSWYNCKVRITPSNFTVINTHGDADISTPHNLTIDDFLTITIVVDEISNAICTVKTKNGEFISNVFSFYGDKEPYVYTEQDCTVHSAICVVRDAKKSVRFYGDSYGSNKYLDRWPRQAIDMGADFFINNLTGGKTADMLPRLIDDFRFGIPKIIMWGLGMNAVADADANTPNSTWKTGFDILLKIGQLLDIEIVGCTIPTTPTQFHEGITNYVKNQSIRIVDFATAVDNGVDNNWIEDALDDDNVHPSEIGAKILAIEALKTVPELMA